MEKTGLEGFSSGKQDYQPNKIKSAIAGKRPAREGEFRVVQKSADAAPADQLTSRRRIVVIARHQTQKISHGDGGLATGAFLP